MSKRSNLVILCLLLFTAGILAGCRGTEYQRSIYEDDTKIVNQADSYTFAKRIGGNKGNNTTLEFTAFTGMQTIWTLTAPEAGNVTVYYDAEIADGKCKAVLITPDNEVTEITENSEKGIRILLQEGKSRIKIVGYDAKGKMTMRFEDYGSVNIK